VTEAGSTPEVNLLELEAVQAELERLHERCERGLILQSEITPELRSLDARARAALPEASDLFRLYDSRMRARTEYWHTTISGYVAPEDCRNVGLRIAVLRQVLKEIEPDFLRAEARAPTQLYFQAGEGYRARQEFYRLLRRAARGVDIADPYLDAIVFDYLEPLEPALRIRLLTGTPKPLFLRQFEALRVARRAIEARSNNRNHDRFVLLDGVEIWHLGASINHLGAKAFMMNRVSVPDELRRVISDFEEWWNSGTAL
jgi:hypothetical protein